jgi:hypothetical protein
MGALFLAAAATLAHDPASRRAATEQGPRLPARVRCYRFFAGREGDRQPACDPLERVRNSDTKEHEMHQHALSHNWTPTGRPLIDDGGGADEARRGEWTVTPPGRLGRRLLADIELYLAFFAIARAG